MAGRRGTDRTFGIKEPCMGTNEKAIFTSDLVKRYSDDILAVDGIDLAIEPNTIYALLGPNGA